MRPLRTRHPESTSTASAGPGSPGSAGCEDRDRVLPGPVCVDAHAHLHEAFDPVASLQAALGHGRHAGAGTVVLCLARSHRERSFEATRRWLNETDFAFEPAPNDPSVLICRGGGTGPSLVLVDGRQLVTAEGIEVLALAVPAAEAADLPSGLSLETTLAAVTESGAVPVLPHGVGKWVGRRGRLVSRAVDLASGDASGRFGGRRLCVADNAGRFTIGPRPSILDQAAALGLSVLAGSDPLPLRGCGLRVGGLGVQLEHGLEAERVGDTLRAQLPKLGPSPRRFGAHAGLLRTCREQVALRLLGRSQSRTTGRAA